MQLTVTQAQIPGTLDYLTLVDWIFFISYIGILTVIVECIWIRRIFYKYTLKAETLAVGIGMDRILEKLAKKQLKKETAAHRRIVRGGNKNDSSVVLSTSATSKNEGVISDFSNMEEGSHVIEMGTISDHTVRIHDDRDDIKKESEKKSTTSQTSNTSHRKIYTFSLHYNICSLGNLYNIWDLCG